MMTSCFRLIVLQTALSNSIIYGFQPSQRCHHLHKSTTRKAVGRTILKIDANHNHNNSNERTDTKNEIPNRRSNENADNNHNKETTLDRTTHQINDLLDQPLFDPDSPSNTNNWFANLVKNDYDTAEALYAGIIITLGVIASQEALRMVKYGAAYVPFHGTGGRLF
ncbi:hypothetical protein HJC23_009043 [Cyclotella cryptica]|uniref:Uncharacterized protein n=1 Tax=Cyclotella cryptica TaxID=29204 RepID=A0ABD3R002_9STRA|eukprot:CCRYP_000651-RA/>CCRYP_000651-RA protein AED:0.28 eAED:-0.63 QI:0/-1/0/1/-1/1/1/0/165